MLTFLKKLNPEQRKAVTYPQGPLLIIAGAGTGKTTVITTRIAWLIQKKKARAEEILALTFTEKAAEEMEERVDKLLPYGYFDLSISTFHSFCDHLLREWGLEIGLNTDFKVLNQTDQWLLLRENLNSFDLDYYQPLNNPAKFIQALIVHFSRLKDENIQPEEYLEYAEKIKEDDDSKMSQDQIYGEKKKVIEAANGFYTYQKLLLQNNALDFGDLINYTLTLLKKRPQILKNLREKFKYILIDEFQDTNWAQYELIKYLARPKNNLTIVADDDQAIYRFRGASTSNVLNFTQDYPKAQIISLRENYRSKQSILDLAYNFIQLNNPDRLENQYQSKNLSSPQRSLSKKLKSNIGQEAIIEHLDCATAEEEVEKLVEKIEQIIAQEKNQISFSDFAVLGRANNALEPFIQGLEQRKIPYLWFSSRGLYQKKIILDVLAYLRLLDNYNETGSLFRVLNLPIFNIDYADLCQINSWAQKKGCPVFQLLEEIGKETFYLNSKIKLKEATIKSIKNLLALIKNHTQLVQKNHSPSEIFIKFLNDSGYLKYIEKQKEQKRRNNFSYLNQFYKKLKNFVSNSLVESTLKNFILKIERELEAGDTGSLEIDLDMGPDAVKLMTIHAAKGLEFKYVFLVNLVDKKFPTIQRKDVIEIPQQLIKEILPSGDAHLQEERRLFYVACTRAKEGLFFSTAKDYGGARTRKVSRFLIEAGIVKKQEKNNLPLDNIPFRLKNPQPSVARVKNQSKKYPLPPKLSFTRFQAFTTCPLQYKYQFILKIPQKMSSSYSFGTSMHNTMLKLFRKLQNKNTAEQTSLFATNIEKETQPQAQISWEELKKIYQVSWIDDWYESSLQQKKFFNKGLKQLKQFYKIYQGNWPQPLFLEKNFNLKLKDWRISGRIDRIDPMNQGKVEIIDYKTSPAKEKLTPEQKTQLLLYQWAVEEILGLQVGQVSYYYLENNQKLSFTGEKKDIEKLKNKFLETIEKLKASAFKAAPGYHCKNCDFKEICDYRKV